MPVASPAAEGRRGSVGGSLSVGGVAGSADAVRRGSRRSDSASTGGQRQRGERWLAEQVQCLVAPRAWQRREEVGPAEARRRRPGLPEGGLGDAGAEEPEVDVLGLPLGEADRALARRLASLLASPLGARPRRRASKAVEDVVGPKVRERAC